MIFVGEEFGKDQPNWTVFVWHLIKLLQYEIVSINIWKQKGLNGAEEVVPRAGLAGSGCWLTAGGLSSPHEPPGLCRVRFNACGVFVLFCIVF